MGTTADKLARLNETKVSMKTAINDPALGDRFADYPVAITDGKAYIAQKITEKGVEASGSDTFQQLGDKVGEIQSGSTGKLEWIKLNAVQTLAVPPVMTQVDVDLPIVGNPIYVFVRIPTVGGGDYGEPYPVLILTAYTHTLGVTPITNGGQVKAIVELGPQIELGTYAQTVSNNKVKIKVNGSLLSGVEYAYIYG